MVDSTFVRPMDVGIWYVFIYNDNDKPLEFVFTASQQGTYTDYQQYVRMLVLFVLLFSAERHRVGVYQPVGVSQWSNYDDIKRINHPHTVCEEFY